MTSLLSPDPSHPVASFVTRWKRTDAGSTTSSGFCRYYGSELLAAAFVEWCTARRMGLGYIHPGKPDQDAFIERFNRTYRDEMLDADLFDSLEQARAIIDTCLETYNTERPHESLGQVPPLTFLPRPDMAAESTFAVST
jgi:transposase InsO family protein